MTRFFSSLSVTAITISAFSTLASNRIDLLLPLPNMTLRPFISASRSASLPFSFMTVTLQPRFISDDAMAFSALYSPIINTLFLYALFSAILDLYISVDFIDGEGWRTNGFDSIFLT